LYCTFHYERKKVKTYYPIELNQIVILLHNLWFWKTQLKV